MKMKLFCALFSLCAVLLVVNLTEAKPEGGIKEIIPISKTYSAPHDKLWQASRDILDEWGYVHEGNPTTNTIKTEPKQLKPRGKGLINFIAQPDDWYASLYITIDGSRVSFKSRYSNIGHVGVRENTSNEEYPEKDNELRKKFFEALDAKIGKPVAQLDNRQSSQIISQPTQPTTKLQAKAENKETDSLPPTLAIVRKAKKEQGLDGYIFQDKKSNKFFLEDSDGNMYKFTGGQWIKLK